MPRIAWIAVASVAVPISLIVLASCGHSKADTAAFCDKVRSAGPALTSPPLDPATASALVGQFKDIGSIAPLSIRADWQQLTDLITQAAKTDTNDSSSVANLTKAAYTASPAARNVVDFVESTCKFSLSDLTTTTPSTSPVTTAKSSSPPTTARRTTTTVHHVPTTTRTTARATTTSRG
jgi:hypothetical protein